MMLYMCPSFVKILKGFTVFSRHDQNIRTKNINPKNNFYQFIDSQHKILVLIGRVAKEILIRLNVETDS